MKEDGEENLELEYPAKYERLRWTKQKDPKLKKEIKEKKSRY